MSPNSVVSVKFKPLRIVWRPTRMGGSAESLTQITPVWRKQIGQALNICLVTEVKKVDIVRRASRTVYDRCNATDDNELYTTLNERRNKPLKVWAHYVLAFTRRRAFSPARRSSATNRMKLANFASRCSGVSLRFSRSNVRSTSRIKSDTRSAFEASPFIAAKIT